MNILIDNLELPDQVEVNRKWYEIRTNYRISILFELMMQDDSLDARTKVRKALDLYYPVIPDDVNGAVDAALWFYKCGKEETSRQRRMVSRSGKKGQVYSFEHDAGYIYAAFLSQYKIDLQEVSDMHWWRFRYLFNSLSKDTEFVKIMEYRSTEISDKMTNEQKDYYRKMKLIHDLPLPKDEEEKQQAIEDALMNGGDLTGIL